MKITKFGHSCLLVEEGGAKILLDPGAYSTAQNYVKNLDAILITHEHGDHLDLNSLEIILNNNPTAKIYTNSGVGKILKEKGIKFELLEDGQKTNIKNVLVEGFGKLHAPAFKMMDNIINVGYLIANRLFCPGDGLIFPNKPVEILALAVVSPMVSAVQAVEYAIKLGAKTCFPAHDAALKITGGFYKVPEAELTKAGIKWVVIKEGETADL